MATDETTEPKKSLKTRLLHEFAEYWANALYMAIFFSAIVFYRRQLLAEHGVELDDYFTGVIKALVIAKVVMVGALFPFAKWFEHHALIVPTLYKAVFFTAWVGLFEVLETSVRALIHAPSFASVAHELQHHMTPTRLAALLVVFVCFIPFFGFKEMSRRMGPGEMQRMFFRRDPG